MLKLSDRLRARESTGLGRRTTTSRDNSTHTTRWRELGLHVGTDLRCTRVKGDGDQHAPQNGDTRGHLPRTRGGALSGVSSHKSLVLVESQPQPLP